MNSALCCSLSNYAWCNDMQHIGAQGLFLLQYLHSCALARVNILLWTAIQNQAFSTFDPVATVTRCKQLDLLMEQTFKLDEFRWQRELSSFLTVPRDVGFGSLLCLLFQHD